MTTPAKPEDKPAEKVDDKVDDKKTSKLIVTAPLVRVEDEGDRLVYLYRGAPLNGVKASEVERLIDLDMVGEDDGSVVPGTADHPEAVKSVKK